MVEKQKRHNWSAGTACTLNKNVYQGYVHLLTGLEGEVEALLVSLKQHFRSREMTHTSYAYRYSSSPATSTEPSNELTEMGVDGTEPGAGEKLLDLMRRWEVFDAIVVVCRSDLSLSGSIVGIQAYRYLFESAKLALEKFAIDSLSPEHASKLAMQELERNKTDAADKDTGPKVHATSIVYRGGDLKMVNGNFVGTKKGRVNHFQADQLASNDAGLGDSGNNNNCNNNNRSNNNSNSLSRQTPLSMEMQHLTSLEPLDISKDELVSLKLVRIPPKELHIIMACVAVLLQFRDTKWAWCREMVHSPGFCGKILQLRPSKLTSQQVDSARALLKDVNILPEHVRRVSSIGAKFLTWIFQLLQGYDQLQVKPEVDNAILPGILALNVDAPEPPPPPRLTSHIPEHFFDSATNRKSIIDKGRMYT